MSEVVTQVLEESVVDKFDDTQEGNFAAGELVVRRNEHGMVSAEWAVGIIAAIAVAGVLFTVVTSGGVRQAILQFILGVIQTFVSQH